MFGLPFLMFRAVALTLRALTRPFFRLRPVGLALRAATLSQSSQRERARLTNSFTGSMTVFSQQFVARTAAAFGCDPIDHFIGVHNVACFTVDAVGGINLQTKLPVSGRSHFVNGSGTEELAGVAVFCRTSWMANIAVEDNQVDWLVFIVIGSRVINIGQLVKGEFAVVIRVRRRRSIAAVVLL